MRRFPAMLRIALAATCLVAACGGGDSPTDPNNNNNNNNGNNNGGGGGNTSGTRMTATIDGQSWTAGTTTGLITAIQFSPKSGGYIITGTQMVNNAIGTGVVITINNIGGVGTYPLGVDAVSVYGGFAGITTPNAGTWNTPISGAAGTISITTLTSSRIAGTFDFTATAAAGGATGSRVLTNGVFDAPITPNAPVAVLTDSMGAKMSSSLNGQAWNAAIVSAGTTATHLSLSGINDKQTLIFTIPKPTAAGTYQLSNNAGSLLFAWDPSAVQPAGARCCYGIAGDVGTITFTSITKTRAKGTFTATLRAQPGTAATGTLTIANGTFDVGLFHNP